MGPPVEGKIRPWQWESEFWLPQVVFVLNLFFVYSPEPERCPSAHARIIEVYTVSGGNLWLCDEIVFFLLADRVSTLQY